MAEEQAHTLSMGRSHHREALETFEMGGSQVEESAMKGSMTWFEWLGFQYFKYSKMLTEKIEKNVYFNMIASRFGQDPGRLALGVTEGYLFYKATYPIHVSLQLYGLVKYVQVSSTTVIITTFFDSSFFCPIKIEPAFVCVCVCVSNTIPFTRPNHPKYAQIKKCAESSSDADTTYRESVESGTREMMEMASQNYRQPTGATQDAIALMGNLSCLVLYFVLSCLVLFCLTLPCLVSLAQYAVSAQ
jgi:hypothetical protein